MGRQNVTAGRNFSCHRKVSEGTTFGRANGSTGNVRSRRGPTRPNPSVFARLVPVRPDLSARKRSQTGLDRDSPIRRRRVNEEEAAPAGIVQRNL